MEEKTTIAMIEPSVTSEAGDSQRWMLTFADLLALLLAFFILMYSMSIITEREWQSMMQSLSHELNPQPEVDDVNFTAIRPTQKIETNQAIDLDYLSAILKEKMQQDNVLMRNISLVKRDGKLSIFIATDNLFNRRDANLTNEAQLILYGIGNVLQSVPNRIEIYANSDEEALQASEYPSHWELSLARSMVVGEMLKKFGNRSIIKAFGGISPSQAMRQSGRSAAFLAGNQTISGKIEVAIRRTTADDI